MAWELLLGAAAAVVSVGSLGVSGRIRGAGVRRNRRRALALPRVTGELEEGAPVAVTGIVRVLDDELVAPLSGRRCVAYDARIRSGDAALSVRGGREVRPFTIDRGAAGIAIVDSEHVELDLAVRSRFPAARVAQFAARNAVARVGRTPVRECCLEPGAQVVVVGMPQLEPAPIEASDERGFRDPPPQRIRILGNREHPVTIDQPPAWYELRWLRRW